MWILYVVFAITSVAGAWYAWRRNPLYSGWKTLKWIGIYLAGIALFVVVINLLIDGANRAHLSSTVSILIFVSFSIGTALAVCLYALKASSPKVDLPATATLLNVNRRRLRRWIKPLVILHAVILLPTLGLFLARIDWWYAFLPVGGILDLSALIAVVSLYYQARIADRALTALELNPWITWRFTSAQWQAFIDSQVAQVDATNAADRAARVPFSFRKNKTNFIAPVVTIFMLFFLFRSMPWVLLGVVVLLASLGVVLSSASRRATANAAVNRRKKLTTVPPEAFFGSGGVFAEGDYIPWLTISSFLTDAWLTPTSLNLRFNKQVASRTGTTTVLEDKVIPLPPNPQNDLAFLQQRLTALCPQAHIALP